jgi:hypothetical protein
VEARARGRRSGELEICVRLNRRLGRNEEEGERVGPCEARADYHGGGHDASYLRRFNSVFLNQSIVPVHKKII